MKTFVYKAKEGPDKVVEGKIVAESTQEVVEKLSQQGFVATFVKEETQESEPAEFFKLRGLFGVRLRELIFFSRHLASLIKSGVPILRALNILWEQTNNPYLRNIIKDIANDVKNGQTLSFSLAKYPKVFSPFYVAMVRAGENSGTADKSLIRISSYYLKHFEFISKVKSALAYPMLILFVGFITVVFIFTNIIPRIVPLLLDLEIELPLPTKILISLSNFVKNYWVWISLGVLIFVLILNRAFKNKTFKYYISMVKLNMPVFGELVFKSQFARFSRTLEESLRSGIPIIRALDISLPIVDEYGLRIGLEPCRKELESGGSLAGSLRNIAIMPPFVVNLVSIGEESGKLADSLADIAESYESDCEEYVKMLTTLLEPMMVLTIGLIVGFIVSAVLWPIFQLNFMSL